MTEKGHENLAYHNEENTVTQEDESVLGKSGSDVQTQSSSAAIEEGKSTAKDSVNLKRGLGLFSGISLIVGTMIGSGIFVSPTGVLMRTGSVGLSLIIWAACGLLSLMGALCYAELGTLVTESGAEWAYFMEGFKGRDKSWYKPIPAFLYSWVSVLLLKPSVLAIICLTCGEYLVRIFYIGTENPPENVLAAKLVACAVIVIVTFINCFSIRLAYSVTNIFTGAKLLAIIIIIIGGIVRLIQGNTETLENGFEGTTSNVGSIATAFYSGLWAYDGWNNLNFVTEELKKPNINLPRSIIIALPLVTVCYVLVNISYLSAMTKNELLASETVAVLFGSRLMGTAGEVIMILSVVLSTFGAANGSCFSGGRLCFVAAREGHLVDVLSYVHKGKLTPTPGLIFNAVIALLLVIPSNVGSLINFFSFTAWIFYGAAMAALLLMRYTKKDVPRPYKVPIIIPIIVLIISVYLVIGPIIDAPQLEYLYASLFIAAGLIFYFPFVYFQKTLPGMDHVTSFFQKILGVVPTEKMPDA